MKLGQHISYKLKSEPTVTPEMMQPDFGKIAERIIYSVLSNPSVQQVLSLLK